MLALLLPMRGVMATTMLCMPDVGAAHAEASRVSHAASHAHEADAHAGEAQAGQGEHAGDCDEVGHCGSDKCNVCCATCSSPAMSCATAGVSGSQEPSAVTFPELSAPAPTFHSEGQERPPRTI